MAHKDSGEHSRIQGVELPFPKLVHGFGNVKPGIYNCPSFQADFVKGDECAILPECKYALHFNFLQKLVMLESRPAQASNKKCLLSSSL